MLKFASCDGCQLSCSTARTSCWRSPGVSRSPYFLEASSAVVEGPYDVSLVEGSITTRARRRAAREVRAQSRRADHDRRLRDRRRYSGACATSPTSRSTPAIVYATPDYISTLRTRRRSATTCRSTSSCAAARSTRACCSRSSARCWPAGPAHALPQRLHRVQAPGDGLRDGLARHSMPGPVTHAGCGALCPSYDRGCYGCFGPKETPNPASLNAWSVWATRDLVAIYRTFNAGAQAFKEVSRAHER